jgi:hypothetical protein
MSGGALCARLTLVLSDYESTSGRRWQDGKDGRPERSTSFKYRLKWLEDMVVFSLYLQ